MEGDGLGELVEAAQRDHDEGVMEDLIRDA